MNWRSASQVGKIEGCLAIPSIRGAEQRKESLVLIDGQRLAVTEGPALWWKIEAKDPDFRQERFSHFSDSL
jgi:hypothetical protein